MPPFCIHINSLTPCRTASKIINKLPDLSANLVEVHSFIAAKYIF